MRDEKQGFDRFAENYSETLDKGIAISGYDSSYFDEYKIRHMHDFLRSKGLAEKPLVFLNFGCGIGRSEPYLIRYFPGAIVHSIDISWESVAIAKERNPGLNNVYFSVFDGLHIPGDTRFDVVLAAGVFHHIPRNEHRTVLEAIAGRLKDDGFFFIFEHNPLNPLTRRIVRSCVFDENAEMLTHWHLRKILREAGFVRLDLRFIVFFPKVLGFLNFAEPLLYRLPLGAQYCAAASKT